MTALLILLAVSCILVGFLLGQMIQQRKCDREIDGLKALHNLQIEQALAREMRSRDEATRLMDSVLAKNRMAPVSEPVAPIKPTAEEKRPLTWREKKKALEERFGKLPIEEQLKIANSSYVYQEKKEG